MPGLSPPSVFSIFLTECYGPGQDRTGLRAYKTQKSVKIQFAPRGMRKQEQQQKISNQNKADSA